MKPHEAYYHTDLAVPRLSDADAARVAASQDEVVPIAVYDDGSVAAMHWSCEPCDCGSVDDGDGIHHAAQCAAMAL